MVNYVHEKRKLTVAKNLRRLIKADPRIRTISGFASAHGCDVRTAKTWLKHGVDRLTTISEIACTLGVDDLELLIDGDERNVAREG